MDTVGLLVLLEAKPGKEDDLASFLAGALPLAQQQLQTTAWFARTGTVRDLRCASRRIRV